MSEKRPYDKEKFLQDARTYEDQRITKQEEWNKKNAEWVKVNGPIPFQNSKLVFDGPK